MAANGGDRRPRTRQGRRTGGARARRREPRPDARRGCRRWSVTAREYGAFTGTGTDARRAPGAPARSPRPASRRTAPSSGSSRRRAAGARESGTGPCPGCSPALRSAWIAHAVDCASDSRPFVSEKPPSRFWNAAERDDCPPDRVLPAPSPPRGAPGSPPPCRSSRACRHATTGIRRPSPARTGSPGRTPAAAAPRPRGARAPSTSSR